MAINTTPRYTYDPAADAAGKKAQTAAQQAKDARIAEAKRRLDAAIQAFQPHGFGGADSFREIQKLTNDYNAAQMMGIPGNPGALNPQKQAEQQIMDATFGRGDQIENDPRLTAAMDALDPTKTQSNAFAQLTDSNAAGAGAQAEMLRQQMAAAGISLNDPAAQARMRSIETGRLQGNNAAIASSQQAGQGAASQLAQVRLAQFGAGQQAYSQGASMLANKQFGQQNVSSGVRPQVSNQGFGQQSSTGQVSSWQAPNQLLSAADAAGKGIDAAMAKNTSTYTPIQVPSQNVQQAGPAQTWGQALQSYQGPQGISGVSAEAMKRLQDQKAKTGTYAQWDPNAWEGGEF